MLTKNKTDITIWPQSFAADIDFYYLSLNLYICIAEGLTLNHSECQIFSLFCHDLSSVLPWRSIGRSSFDRCLHNNDVDSKKT